MKVHIIAFKIMKGEEGIPKWGGFSEFLVNGICPLEDIAQHNASETTFIKNCYLLLHHPKTL